MNFSILGRPGQECFSFLAWNLSIVQVESSDGRCQGGSRSTGVDTNYEWLFPCYNEVDFKMSFVYFLKYLLTSPCEVASPSRPKAVPQIVDWNADVADVVAGTWILLIPSGLRLGMKIYELIQFDAPVLVGKVPTWNGSGDVVDDSLNCIPQYPFSVLMQLT